MKNNNIFFILIIIISLLVILPRNSISSFGETTTVPEIFYKIQNTETKTSTFTLVDEPDFMNIICVGGGGSGGSSAVKLSGKPGSDTTVTLPGIAGVVKASGGAGGSGVSKGTTSGLINIGALGGAVQTTGLFTTSTAGGGGSLGTATTIGNGGGAGTSDSNGDDGDALFTETNVALTGNAGEGFVTKDQLNISLKDKSPPYYENGYGYGSAPIGTGVMSGGGGGGYTSYSLPVLKNSTKQPIPTGLYVISVGAGGLGNGNMPIISKSGGQGYAVVTYSYTKYLVQFINRSTNTAVVTNESLKYYIRPKSIYLVYLNKNKDYTFLVNVGLSLDKRNINKLANYNEIIISDDLPKAFISGTSGLVKISFFNETSNKLSGNGSTIVEVTISKNLVDITLYVISDNETYHYLTNGKYNITVKNPAFKLSQSGDITIVNNTLFTISKN